MQDNNIDNKEKIKILISELVVDVLEKKEMPDELINIENINNLLQTPPNQELGDFSLPVFVFSKSLKKAPNEIAEELSKKINTKMINEKVKEIESVKSMGAYVNFFLNKSIIINSLKIIHKEKEKFGSFKKIKEVILVESPSPNTNKPLHLGHVRNMIIGKSLTNILNANGYQAYLVNVNNDRGIHICKSMLAYQKWGNDDSPKKSNIKSDFFVGKYYVLFSQKVKETPELNNEAQELLKKWEEKDPKTLALWKKMNKWAFDGFQETYKTFNMNFKKQYYESQTYEKGKQIVLDGVKKGIFHKDSDDSIMIDLTSEGYDKKVLLRSDGTTVYITQDLYLAKKRFEEFKFSKMIYVVGNEQKYHFEVLFNIFKKLQYNFAKDCYHYAYGMINLPSGKMKSREGTVVDADTIVKDMVRLTREEIRKRHPDIKEKELLERSKKIAMSAIIFHILKFDPKRDFVFNPEESISFEGETGPYIQYVYARINSIVNKSTVKASEKNISKLIEDQELSLIKKLSEYTELVKKISENYKISLIPRYLLELCQEFNNYYSSTKIIQDNKELESARLYLITSINTVINNALSLLGIAVVDEM